MFFPDLDNFKQAYNKGESQLVYTRLIADTETPVSVFLKLGADKTPSVLLESVEGGEVLGRYSAIGMDPDLFWTCNNGCSIQSDVISNALIKPDLESNSEPLSEFRALIKASSLDNVPEDLPPMTSSGLFGYMGYDMIRQIEDIPNQNPDALDMPDAVMMRPKLMVVFDNIKHILTIATPVRVTANDANGASPEALYKEACAYLENAKNKIKTMSLAEAEKDKKASTLKLPLNKTSNFTRETYGQAVQKAKEHIVAGDIFQVVPSQRFTTDFDLPAFSLYRSLRRLNPSPFLFFVNFVDFTLVGSSPEILVRVRDGKMTIRPIAGTRKRGKDKAEDEALKQDLLSDPKERAEHLMLLDLGRNDVGRVCKIGSVNVTDSFITEMYSHVMHIVSNVEGQLKDNIDGIDALFAGFPAGTVSGAPKIRAMQIIDDLETIQRKFYGGCIGYFDGNGDVDTCIALRTGLIKDGKLHIQAGGGVVADSSEQGEYEETVNKSMALMAAAQDAITMSKA